QRSAARSEAKAYLRARKIFDCHSPRLASLGQTGYRSELFRRVLRNSGVSVGRSRRNRHLLRSRLIFRPLRRASNRTLIAAKKKRSAFPAERSCITQRIRYSTTIKSGSPVQITRSVYTKPSTSTATHQPSRNTKYVFPINRKWFAPNRWTKNSFGCPRSLITPVWRVLHSSLFTVCA